MPEGLEEFVEVLEGLGELITVVKTTKHCIRTYNSYTMAVRDFADIYMQSLRAVGLRAVGLRAVGLRVFISVKSQAAMVSTNIQV